MFVNLYWDATWDTDNPSMTKQQLDTFTTALLSSSYFGHLSEYGVGAPSYAGGFLPAPLCPPKAPSSVGFYDPFNTSIIGFLQCELDHGSVPQGSQVVYNVLLPGGMPTGSIESDFFGADKFCAGGPAVAWHFHQTPYSAQAVLGIGAGLLGAATGGVQGALLALLGALGALQGGPLYTIVSADSRCGSFSHNLLHEMVEAASDPFPPPSVILNGGGGEVVDICDMMKGVLPSHPFVPPVVPITNVSFPTSSGFTNAITIVVPQYWSNYGQTCLTGFTNTQTPVLPKANITMTGNGAAATFTLTGSGFGTLPPPLNVPTSAALPYIAVQDTTQGWQIGNSLNTDLVTLNTASWSNAIVINGFNFTSGNLIMKSNDNLTFWVCNPASGNCTSTDKSLTESGVPQLKVFIFNTGTVNLSYNVFVDGNKVAGPIAGGDTGWLALTPGIHTVTETQTSAGFITERFTGACDATGKVTLNLGDNNTCSIINIASGACPTGQHCCSTPTTSAGCIPGCVPNATACQPLCSTGFNKCCGSALPNGRCDAACVKSPPQVCK